MFPNHWCSQCSPVLAFNLLSRGFSNMVVLKLESSSELPGGLVITENTWPTPRVSGSVGLGRGPVMLMQLTGSWVPLREPCSNVLWRSWLGPAIPKGLSPWGAIVSDSRISAGFYGSILHQPHCLWPKAGREEKAGVACQNSDFHQEARIISLSRKNYQNFRR